MVNKVILIGNLGAEPEVRRLESGATVAKFRMATNRNYRDKSGEWQKVTQWHNVVAWRQLAERVERDFAKGKLVYVEGELTHRKYMDKDGNERYTTEVAAYSAKLLEKREAGVSEYITNYGSDTLDTPTDTSTAGESDPAMDDDLPF